MAGFVREWKPTRPMILGQRGFFDQFTVTMSGHAQHVSVEGRLTFDLRFQPDG